MRLCRLFCRMKYFWAWEATCVGVRLVTNCREMPRQSPWGCEGDVPARGSEQGCSPGCHQGVSRGWLTSWWPRTTPAPPGAQARTLPSFCRPTRKRRCSCSVQGTPGRVEAARRDVSCVGTRTPGVRWAQRHAGGQPAASLQPPRHRERCRGKSRAFFALPVELLPLSRLLFLRRLQPSQLPVVLAQRVNHARQVVQGTVAPHAAEARHAGAAEHAPLTVPGARPRVVPQRPARAASTRLRGRSHGDDTRCETHC